jgi:hypothetical protein
MGPQLGPFQHALEAVIRDKNYVNDLFTDCEMKFLASFREVKLATRKLCVRLFEKSWMWMDPGGISATDIADDLLPCIDELATFGFLEKGTIRFIKIKCEIFMKCSIDLL